MPAEIEIQAINKMRYRFQNQVMLKVHKKTYQPLTSLLPHSHAFKI